MNNFYVYSEGEYAIIQLINAVGVGQHEVTPKSSAITYNCLLKLGSLQECPDQFQFAKDIALEFGYEVRVLSCYGNTISNPSLI